MRAATSGLRCAPFASVRWRSRPRRSLHCALRPPPAKQPSVHRVRTPALPVTARGDRTHRQCPGRGDGLAASTQATDHIRNSP